MNAFKVNRHKDNLIRLLAQLEIGAISVAAQEDIKKISTHLSRKNILISDSSTGKNQIEEFIALVFSAFPGLMTAKNKEKLEQFFTDTIQNTPSSMRNKKK